MENTTPQYNIDGPQYNIDGASNTATTQATVDQLAAYAADLLINKDMSGYQVKKHLVLRGLSEENANILVDRLEEQIDDAHASKANKDMIWGAIWCVGGIAITAATYSSASGGGGYVVMWGAIIFGGIQFIKGAVASSSR